ncbi:MAG TPA: ATP-binding protein [Terriglobales bacterium]|nr:ATP-binding protein [Terriglobales bacterium]
MPDQHDPIRVATSNAAAAFSAGVPGQAGLEPVLPELAPVTPNRPHPFDLKEASMSSTPVTDPKPHSMRLNWQVKTVLPVAFVLLNGLLLFLLLTLSLKDPERHAVLEIAGGGAVAICAVLIFALAYFVQKPMVELQEKIARLGEGDLEVRVSFSNRNDEMGDLGRNFNRMVEQLRESRTEIERLHRTQMSRAEHLATLGELATGLAHEIRNPLAGIAGVIEIVSRDLPPTSPARAVVKDVRLEIAQINRIVTDLLETARPRPPEIRPSDLNTTIEHAVMLARQQVLSKPITIELQKAPELPAVEHDGDQMHQVLLNLLINSVQAMDHGGTVRVQVSEDHGVAKIAVSDNGKGIPADNIPNIFRPFFTTKGNGTGLGLSLAKRIVEDHQGRIEVVSELGKGTKFVISLPFKRPALRIVAS